MGNRKKLPILGHLTPVRPVHGLFAVGLLVLTYAPGFVPVKPDSRSIEPKLSHDGFFLQEQTRAVVEGGVYKTPRDRIPGESVSNHRDDRQSRYEVEKYPISLRDSAEIAIQVFQEVLDNSPSHMLPVRAIVVDQGGRFADGSGRGVYSDGRFFADGFFLVRVPKGVTGIKLSSGPNHIPLTIEFDVEAGLHYDVKAFLYRWFEPEAYGWFSGDNHVHAQHDRTATIHTDLSYAALQSRANGLSFMTEQGSSVSYEDMETLSSDRFLLRFTPELRPGPFTGHLNTPGIDLPFSALQYKRLVQQPLPVQALVDEVHRRGGALIHTHPTTPPQQLHWMGAFELFSDAVLGKTADALDQDNALTQALWFAVLNLGNNMAASGYTDAALGRPQTLAPGDRRIYVHADSLTYPAVVRAIRRGETLATNSAPLFPFFSLEDAPIGSTLTIDGSTELTAKIDVHTLHPLTRMVLFCDGIEAHVFDVSGETGHVSRVLPVQVTGDKTSWFVLRAESEGDYWAVTSPIYLEPSGKKRRPAASAIVFQISNATRFIELRPDYFAHMMVTTSPGTFLTAIELLRDSKVVRRFIPGEGDSFFEDKIPVTEAWGDYGPGWIWFPSRDEAVHFQADWPVEESGWFSIRVFTGDGRTYSSDKIFFDATNPDSQQIGVAQLDGDGTSLRLYGYGEEMPVGDITLPFEGDHWWYPRETYYHMKATFGDTVLHLGQPQDHPAAQLFRAE